MGKNLIALLLCTLLLPIGMYSQNRTKLEKDRRKIQEEIRLATKMLEETRSQKEASLSSMKLLQKQIALREQLSRKLRYEVVLTKKEIITTEASIEQMIADLTHIREEYGKLAYATYKAMYKKPQAFYIFSSSSINDGYNRARYFREFSKFQESQIETIKQTKEVLAQKKLALIGQKANKEALLITQIEERKKLDQSKIDKKDLFEALKKDEKKIKTRINEKKKLIEKLNRDITKMIELENEKLSKAQRDLLLPLSNDFRENKGKLPWPLPSGKGLITSNFGVEEDELGIKTNNNGVDISTTKGMEIRAIFQGKVVEVQSIPFYGNVVIVQHGGYYTVYTHLSASTVKKGQEVEKLQQIGTAKTDKGSGETKVQFQIFKGKQALDPAIWLARKY